MQDGPNATQETEMMTLFSKSLILAAFGSALFVAPAQAVSLDDRYESRSVRQATLIDRGVSTGRINAREATRLNVQQGRIETRQDRLAADGSTRRDHALIRNQQANAARNIGRAGYNRR
jgi:hypothetical protein